MRKPTYIQRHDKTPKRTWDEMQRIYNAVDEAVSRLNMTPKFDVLYHEKLDIVEGTHDVIYIPFDYSQPAYVISFQLDFFKEPVTMNLALGQYMAERYGDSFSDYIFHTYLNEFRNIL